VENSYVTFGVDIEFAERSLETGIPLIVKILIDKIEERDISQKGIYRVNGQHKEVLDLMELVKTEGVGALQQAIVDTDLYTLCSLLKNYFSQLPDPLICSKFYQEWVNASQLTNEEQKIDVYTRLLFALPRINFRTLRVLSLHLVRVSKHQHTNKMNMENISTVFAPTLLYDPNQVLNPTINLPNCQESLAFIFDHIDWTKDRNELISSVEMKNLSSSTEVRPPNLDLQKPYPRRSHDYETIRPLIQEPSTTASKFNEYL